MKARRESDAKSVEKAARTSMHTHVEAMLAFHARGIPTLDYGNNIRQVAKDEGLARAIDFPGFVPTYIRPLFCWGIGPFRWATLSGDAQDIDRTDAKMKELLPDNAPSHRWLDMARGASPFRACRPASAGWAWATDTASASPSMTWCERAS